MPVGLGRRSTKTAPAARQTLLQRFIEYVGSKAKALAFYLTEQVLIKPSQTLLCLIYYVGHVYIYFGDRFPLGLRTAFGRCIMSRRLNIDFFPLQLPHVRTIVCNLLV